MTEERRPVSQVVWDMATPKQRQYLVVEEDNLPANTPMPSQRKAQARNKWTSIVIWSELCQRWLDSKTECARGEELWLMQKAGEITNLCFQVKFVLCESPVVTITIDFSYIDKDGEMHYEDVKGWRLTKKTKKRVPRVERDFRVKMAWLQKDFGIFVNLV